MIPTWFLTVVLVLGAKTISIRLVYAHSSDDSESESCTITDSVNKIFNITARITAEFDATNFLENVPIKSEYDFVIVGSAPSGCVLANRLSGEGNRSVLLLEAGSAENPIVTNIPMSAPNLQLSNYNWNYETEVQENACLCMSW